MSLNESAENVAVLIDYENIVISYTKKYGADTEVSWKSILEMAAKYGRVVIRKAYADWTQYGGSQRDLLSLGFEPCHVATKKRGHNVADIKLVIDALDMFIVRDSGIKYLLLMSGDGDFSDLVHYLRASGKYVLGIGIKGASAEYLIKACDEFKYYETIEPIKIEAPVIESAEIEETSFDLNEARQLLRGVMETAGDEWIACGPLKVQMQRINPDFDERNYKFERFMDFLNAQPDFVETRYNPYGGHLEVRMVRKGPEGRVSETPETLLDDYLLVLAKSKITMTPSALRLPILGKIFAIVKDMKGLNFLQMREEIYRDFEEKSPEVKLSLVKDVVHQMYMSGCLNIDKSANKYPPEATRWEREAELDGGITNTQEFIKWIDLHLLKAIKKGIAPKELDLDVALRVLYGTSSMRKLKEHVEKLVRSLEPA
jgi:uncharacterized LabA/DUF88 family protein